MRGAEMVRIEPCASSALKRRFNFETVHPIADAAFERELVARQVGERRHARDLADPLPARVDAPDLTLEAESLDSTSRGAGAKTRS